ncbi:MAG: hypothetical protein WA021_01660, partial [Minisyncoccia bacterium]
AKNRYGGFSPQIHVDCADGIFAPNKTWAPLSGEKLPDSATILYEAHLMIDNPLSHGLAFARAGAQRIVAHVEAFNNAECAREAFDMWQKAGAKEIGVAILLDTSLQELMPYVSLVDFVHIMTIAKVGKQGFKFDERAIQRVADVHSRYPNLIISTDGGETVDNVDDLARAGASRFCIGAALAKAKDPAKEYSRLLNAASVV